MRAFLRILSFKIDYANISFNPFRPFSLYVLEIGLKRAF